VDNLVTGSVENIRPLLQYENFKYLRLDINDEFDLKDFPELTNFNLEGSGVQEVFNLACPNVPKDFEKLKEMTLLSNSIGVINTLEIASKYKAKYFFASSSVVYGGNEDQALLVSENDFGAVDTMSPRAAYEEGKRFAESLVVNYGSIYGFEVHIGRIFRTFGPRMGVGFGHLIPDVIQSALNHTEVVLYGSREHVSSFVYIDDMISGILKVMEKSDYQLPVNLGSSDAYRLVDVVNQILFLTESKSKVRMEPPLPFMRQQPIPDLSLVKSKIGWFPIVSINDGLRKTIEDTMSKLGLVKFESK
jgi:UDP-glucuronate decarboxylase